MTRRGKKDTKAKNYNKFKYNNIFFFYKHFMKSLTLIACDRSSKVTLFFLIINYFYVQYKILWFSFLINRFKQESSLSQRDNNITIK